MTIEEAEGVISSFLTFSVDPKVIAQIKTEKADPSVKRAWQWSLFRFLIIPRLSLREEEQ